MTDRSRAGRIARDRGKRWEREVANYMKQWFPNAHRRGYDQAGNAVRAAGEQTPDVAGTPYWIECKSRSAVATATDIHKWLLEMEGHFPDKILFVHDKNGAYVIVTHPDYLNVKTELDLLEFAMWMDFDMYKEWAEHGHSWHELFTCAGCGEYQQCEPCIYIAKSGKFCHQCVLANQAKEDTK